MKANMQTNGAGVRDNTHLAIYHASIIDAVRFPHFQDEVMARLGEYDVAHYPDADELDERGFCLASIAFALKSGQITPAELGDLVDDVAFGEVSIARANQRLFSMRTLADRKRSLLDEGVLSGLGLDVNAVFGSLHRKVTPNTLFRLVRSICQGTTSLDDANTGLGCLADDANERRVYA